MDAHVISLANQKGGTAKTTTCANLGIGLAQAGRKVLLVDADAQGSLTLSLGWEPDKLPITLYDLMIKAIQDRPVTHGEGMLHHEEGVDLLPANIELAGMEMSLVSVMYHETILKQVIEPYKHEYDYILIDCAPSLGMMTINALAATDGIVVPTIPQHLPTKGIEKLLESVHQVRRGINPSLKIEGILMTLMDGRTVYEREISEMIRNAYGGKINIFGTEIPRSVRAAETSAEGKSIFAYAPRSKVAEAYRQLTKEVLALSLIHILSILAGVTTAMRAGESGGAMRGACVGLLYMALGIVCYALMMGQSPRLTAYLADLGMGLAAGGLFGMILTARKTG